MTRFKQILLNETGQMSIFVALIFQVLFVFFAMVINIGLLIHDKINLQNAVDLGAYYAAQRQAEVLNEIAHVNYQIRQDWKLLTWRYRVLGTMGRFGPFGNQNDNTFPPAIKPSGTGSLQDRAWASPGYGGSELPSVCVANNYWSEFVTNSSQEENYCFRPYNIPTPLIPPVQVIASFVPGVTAAAGFTAQAQAAQLAACRQAGPLNWAFTMQIIYAYKLAIATRKQIIWELRKNLIAADPKDRRNDSVKDGVLATVRNNLTSGNRDGFDEGGFQVINGLANPACNKGDGGEFVIGEIKTYPVLYYTWIDPGAACETRIVNHQAYNQLDGNELNKWDPSGLMRYLATGEPQPTNPEHSSLGFEKNPWCMAYVGVKARTRTYKPFAPFGNAIELSARAFAQPFGGRIGPWDQERWSRGSDKSNSGQRVDPLTPPRLVPGTQETIGPNNARKYLPNHSRYPGDTIGAESEITMGAQNALLKGIANSARAQRFKLGWFGLFDNIPSNGDVLAQNGSLDFPMRKAEISAVVPDLFDVTYYSIDPAYWANYINAGPNRFSGIPQLFGQQVRQINDIGGRMDDQTGAKFNVEDQIKAAFSGGFDQSILSKLYYPIRQWEHLLTGWAPNRVQNFDFPQERFGKCSSSASDAVMIPGKCAIGGRTGYSVRLISRAHLLFPNWKVGGEGEPESPILNPPDTGF